jgi:hypothetical protein
MRCVPSYVAHLNRNIQALERAPSQLSKHERQCADITTRIRTCRAAILDNEHRKLPVSSVLAVELSELTVQLRTLENEIEYLSETAPA